MTLDEYQLAARRTMNEQLTDGERLLDAAAGLSEESGEVLALVRKAAFQRRPFDPARLREELGDALWCLAGVATAVGASLGDIAARNLEKIVARPVSHRSPGSDPGPRTS
jgi:NTP pyrophosphatase (non-canonical NTP hydrolase)